MSLWLLVCCALVGLALRFWWKHTQRLVSAASRAERPRPTPLYRGVSIKPQQDSCAGARQIAGKRFLACAAPLLPIDNCDSSACRCRYARFDDRRQDQRRGWNAIQQGFAAGPTADDRRNGSDRRGSLQFVAGMQQASLARCRPSRPATVLGDRAESVAQPRAMER